MEMEIEIEIDQTDTKVLESKQRRDDQMEYWWSRRMIRELVLDMVKEVPGVAVINLFLTRVAQLARGNESRRLA